MMAGASWKDVCLELKLDVHVLERANESSTLTQLNHFILCCI